MSRTLDLALIRTFVAVADAAGMTAAANRLHLTQGAVSQQVRRLEEALNCRLFARERGLRLTPAGERLIGHARQLLRLSDDVWASFGGRTVRGPVRLGAPYDLVGGLASAIRACAAAWPEVEVSLVCAASPDLRDELAAGEVDLAVIEEPVGPSAGECLAVERLVWVGARAGTAHTRRPLPVSMVAETCAFRPAVLAALGGHGLDWRTVFESGAIEATMATVRADLAVSAWLETTVPPDLAILGPGAGLPELPHFAITLHRPPGAMTPAAQALAEAIRESFAATA